ncbi:aminotransferase class I/II-fold pyridoxal phosphate-dependent enzyme [Marinomonas sp. 5E14-1]|uniref:aminotransferase class I/II-fold pyridoxal phosphate-dependent enzyme n=1 Tax=Marinomonas sp. 5E14-1 TaxID=3153922 RepID=UPI003266734D
MQALLIRLMPSDTAIQPIIIVDNGLTLETIERLRQLRIWCVAIRPPTVPVGSARLRITLSADHSDGDLVLLCDSLEQILTSEE